MHRQPTAAGLHLIAGTREHKSLVPDLGGVQEMFEAHADMEPVQYDRLYLSVTAALDQLVAAVGLKVAA